MTKRQVFGLLLAAALTTGCGDVITYSKISRDQGKIDLENSDFDKAQGAFTDAIRQNPRDYESHYYLGTIFARDGQYANAVAEYRNSLNTQGFTYEGQSNIAFRVRTIQALADALAKVHDRDASINTLETKAPEDPTGETYYVLGRVYATRGDADSALTAYGKAADVAPKTFFIVKEYGLYQEKMGQKDAAQKTLLAAYRLNQQDNDVNAALRRLGIVPGPSLLDPSQLAKPMFPKGPIPDYLDHKREPLPQGPTGVGPAD
ncbi:MAG: tetratricopeptide repeat protein [Tepidisphaeraceae bacterium]